MKTRPGSRSDLVGVWVVDKPQGLTSFDVLRRLKGKTGPVRMGHTGTLDPMATGVLPVCLGEATRLLNFMKLEPKKYRGRLRLGLETDSWDITGHVVRQDAVVEIPNGIIMDRFAELVGEQYLEPPLYSAVKYKGKPLYRYARKGEYVETAPRRMFITSFELLGRENNDIVFELVCGRGTYVRSVVQCLGERLGCGACLVSLRRLRCGSFTAEDARTLEQMEEILDGGEADNTLIPIEQVLGHLASCSVSGESERKIRHGNRLSTMSVKGITFNGGRVGERILVLAGGRGIAVTEIRQDGARFYLQPLRVLNRQ